MTILSFKKKRDKEELYRKAKKMEEYASMIVECLEEAGYDDEENYRRSYREHDEEYDPAYNRYDYRRVMR